MRPLGKKVQLRSWQDSDRIPLLEALSPDRRWMKFDGPYFAKPSRDDLEGMVAAFSENFEGVARRLVISGPDDQLLGLVSWYWESFETRWPGIGIVLYDDAVWGKGLGFDALGLWCEYLFSNLDIRRLDLRTWSGNKPMQRVALKLGFKEEARFRDARVVDGIIYDSVGFGILRAEWQARYPRWT
jgi:RimJ/RimL family protein N-acetyltransferase